MTHGNGNQVRQVPNGLTPAAGEVRYTFDQRNRLIRIENHDGSGYQVQAEAAYDGVGNRLRTVAYVNSVAMTTTYTLDLQNSGMPLVVNDGTSQTLILYGLFGLGEYREEWTYYLGDAQLSVRQLIEANNVITLSRTYDPFGLIVQQAGEGASLYGFAGTQAGGGGLLYSNGRYFDPSTGRFLPPHHNFDPRRPGTLNGYLASLFLANPGGLFFGPLLVLNSRRRRNEKGHATPSL